MTVMKGKLYLMILMLIPTFIFGQISNAVSPLVKVGNTVQLGVVGIGNGGTGGTTRATAINKLLPTQSGQTGKFLTTNGTDASWTNTLSIANLTISSFNLGVVKSSAGGVFSSALLLNADVSASANIDATKLGTGLISTNEFNYLDGVTSAIQTQINTKEPTIVAGTTAQYRRGDNTWQTLDKTAVGLANVDNTSDVNKPISTSAQTALNLKANLASPTFSGAVNLPTGTIGVTQTAGNSTTALATTAFVTTADNLKMPYLGGVFTGNITLNSNCRIGKSTTGQDNIYFGQNALLVNSGNYSTAIGSFALAANSTGGGNTAVGHSSLINNTIGAENVAIGLNALYTNYSGMDNTVVGYNAFNSNLDGNNNTVIGANAGYSANGNNNVFLGYNSGNNMTTGSGNTILGTYSGSGYSNRSNRLWLSDGVGNVKIMADSVGNVGIGTSTPTVKFDVAGSGRFVAGQVTVEGSGSGFVVKDQAGSGNSYRLAVYGGGGKLRLEKQFAGGNAQPLVIDGTTGYIGLNQSSPTFPLDIGGNSRIYDGDLTLQMGAVGGRIIMPLGAALNKILVSDATGIGTWQTPVTQTAGDNTTAIATTAFVTAANNLKLNIASPTTTGTLTAPTIANTLGANFATTSGNVGIGAAAITDKLEVTGNLSLRTAGNKIKITTGTNASVGTSTLASGTVVVSTTAVTASSIILLTVQETGTFTGTLRVSAKTAGTSFTITSSGGTDTAVVGWLIIN